MKTVLFQGDSITDACRQEEYICHQGMGYPAYVAGRLGASYPNEFRFVNRGISGDRITDLYARRERDILDIKPNVLSVLVGVNDVWRTFDNLNGQEGVDTPRFTAVYKKLLEEILAALPDVKIMLLEPFVQIGTGTEPYYDAFRACVEEKAGVVQGIAKEYSLAFVPLQETLDRLCREAPGEHWTVDGVHPTIYFHQHIADSWMETYKTIAR